MSRQLIALCTGLLALLNAAHAQFQPYSWQQTITSAPANPVIRDIEALASGNWRVRTYGSEFVLDQNLAITNAKFGSYSDRLAGAARVLALADGGSITLDGREVTDRIGGALDPLNIGPDRCTVRRYDAQQQLLWRQQLAVRTAERNEHDSNCSHLAMDASQIWVLKATSALRLANDGALLAKVTLAQANSATVATDLVASTAGGVFVSLAANSATTSSASVVISLDRLGVERWRHAGTDMRRFSQLLAMNDGGVIALSSAPNAAKTQLTRLDDAGQLIWERAIDATYVRAEITSGQSLRILTTESAERAALLAFSADGDFLWRAPSSNASNLKMRVANGVTAVSTNSQMIVLGAQGETVFSAPLAAGAITNFALSVDGKRAMLQTNVATLQALDLTSGQITPVNLQSPGFGISNLSAVAASQAGAFIAVQTPGQFEFELHYLAANGQTRWQRRFTASSGPKVAADATTACTSFAASEQIELHCFDIASNQVVFSSVEATPTPIQFGTATWVVNDLAVVNGVVTRTLRRGNFIEDQMRFQGFERNGTKRFEQNFERLLGLSVLNETGFTVASVGTLKRVDSAGNVIASHPLSTTRSMHITPLSEGTLINDLAVLRLIDLQGQEKWRQTLAAYPNDFGADSVIKTTADLVLVLSVPSYFDIGIIVVPTKTPVAYAFNRATGALVWQKQLESAATEIGKILLDEVVFLSMDAKGAEIREFVSLATGNTTDLQSSGVDRRRLANFAFSALPNFTNPLSDYFVLPTRSELGGSEITVQKRQFQTRAKEVIGSFQRVGAWHNPESPGQGFFLEQIGNVQFLAWFHGTEIDTYNQDSLAPKHLTWLTMQGDANASDKVIALKIYDTRQGTFATASANTPLEIGSARLDFYSCTEATLSYEYARENPDPGIFLSGRDTGFVRGVIPLRSLLPATNCASSTALPAPISDKTGLFHDPNVAGQGLMTVFNQGTLFGGWFSFDPQGAADDSAKQLWFTLQASNISSNPNRISTRIYRTLGARRDQQSSTSSMDIGEAILDFTACDKLTVRYQFIDTEAALAMRGLHGVLQLQRIGACRAP